MNRFLEYFALSGLGVCVALLIGVYLWRLSGRVHLYARRYGVLGILALGLSLFAALTEGPPDEDYKDAVQEELDCEGETNAVYGAMMLMDPPMTAYGSQPLSVMSNETNVLSICDFRYSNDVVQVTFAWSRNQTQSYFIDVFASSSLTNGTWAYLDEFSVRGCYNFKCVCTIDDWSVVLSNLVANGRFPVDAALSSAFFTGAWHFDSDNDGLSDAREILESLTNPKVADSDGDGLDDFEEVDWYHTDAWNPDTDGDGLGDCWEAWNDSDPLVPMSVAILESDDDIDGLTFLQESIFWTDPDDPDTDWDGMPDGWEVLYGFNPKSAYADDEWRQDPDQDGWSNFTEYEEGTNPLNPDTDFDGLLDGSDPRPLIPDGSYLGQCDDWVSLAYPNEADAILQVGYTNWVNNQVGVGLQNGYCKFTAYFPEAPTTNTLLKVGPFRVVVNSAGEYPFLLEKGIEYGFGTYPFVSNVVYTAIDDMGPPPMQLMGVANEDVRWTVDGGEVLWMYPTFSSFGSFSWLPVIRGTPDVSYIGPYSHINFSVEVQDCRKANSFAYHWLGENADLVIDSPNTRSTGITFTTIPSWRQGNLRVEVVIGTNTLVSVLNDFSYGEHSTPQVHLGLSAPSGILLNQNEAKSSKLMPITLDFSSDVPVSGTVRFSCVHGNDHVALWRTRQKASISPSDLERAASGFEQISCYVEGIGVSEELEDVVFRAEFIPDEGEPIQVDKKSTVIKVKDVVLPDAPEDGLVVLAESLVGMKVDCEPEGAGSLLTTLWYLRQLRADGGYTDWVLKAGNIGGDTYNHYPQFGGIFQIKAIARVATGAADTRYYLVAHDDDLSIGDRKKGLKDSFGVVSCSWQLSLWQCAMRYVGSEDYLSYTSIPAQYGCPACAAGYKCNIFVAHRIVESGLPRARRSSFKQSPPLANEWGDVNFSIQNWNVERLFPEPGYVIAEPGGSPDDAGHVGIVDYDGYAISAGAKNVNRKFKPRTADFSYRYYTEE